MKKMIYYLVVLAVVLTWLPALAQEHKQSIFQVRSRDVGNPSPEHLAKCGEMANYVRTPGEVVRIIPLNAEFWSLETRAKDGLVKNEFVRQVGTVEGCAYFVRTEDGRIVSELYGDAEVSGLTFEAWGECETPIVGLPAPGSLTGTCSIVLNPDPGQGIAGGIMTSNSVLGEATGSFWTIRIIWE